MQILEVFLETWKFSKRLCVFVGPQLMWLCCLLCRLQSPNASVDPCRCICEPEKQGQKHLWIFEGLIYESRSVKIHDERWLITSYKYKSAYMKVPFEFR